MCARPPGTPGGRACPLPRGPAAAAAPHAQGAPAPRARHPQVLGALLALQLLALLYLLAWAPLRRPAALLLELFSQALQVGRRGARCRPSQAPLPQLPAGLGSDAAPASLPRPAPPAQVVAAGLAVALLQGPGGDAPPAALHWALVISLLLLVAVLGGAELLRLLRAVLAAGAQAVDAADAACQPRQPAGGRAQEEAA
jgi:hypothetical protein